MEETTRNPQLHVVVLKWDRLYGDMIRRQVWDVWPNAVVRVYQRGLDALSAMQELMPDLFVTGVKIEDTDGLEHLEPFIHTSLPILIVTSRADFRTYEMLRQVRYDGIFDGRAEGLEHLGPALRQVMQHKLYMSPSLVPHLQTPKRKILKDLLTPKQQIVLSVIGDGSGNKQAAERLCMSEHTVKTHRKRIMARLGLHEQGELMLFALRNGFVLVTDSGILYPGFQRTLRSIRGSSVAVPTIQLQPEPVGFERPRLFVSRS
jgi:DNA-binding NarL/FixJ family response regulator